MFVGIREKVHSVQENFSSSFRILNVSTDVPFVKKPDLKNLSAGGDILQKTLSQWNDLHTIAEENARKALEADSKINAICTHTNVQLSQMSKLCFTVNLIPKLVDKTKTIINQTKKLNVLFKGIENSLNYLEEIIQMQKVQGKQLEGRFKLAMYKEIKLRQLENLREKFEKNYNNEVKIIEEKKSILLKERQTTFDEAFKQDLAQYKLSGNLNVINMNKINTNTNSMTLEDVELDVDNSELIQMLGD